MHGKGVHSPIHKRVVIYEGTQPQPGFELCLLKNLFNINYSLLEDNIIPLFPDTPHYRCPKTFPEQVLFVTHLN